jgi:hypothetical protein
VTGPGGILHTVEILGPPSLAAWKENYDVLFSALIMLDLVRRPQLAAYRAKITAFHARYGPKCWALLYQADVRCRSELMDRLRFRLQALHNAALQCTPPKATTFDPTRPWDSVWAAALADTEFWSEEFSHDALLIITGTTRAGDVLGDDAIVSSASASAAQQPAERQHPPTKPKKPTNTDKGPCKAYNAGKCPGKTCSKGFGRHVCAICGNSDHGASNCTKQQDAGKGNKRKWSNAKGGRRHQ